MPTETPAEKSLRMKIAAHRSWALTRDRSARTAAARRASHHDRFVREAREMHPDATEQQIAQAADQLRSAYFKQLALRSAASRRRTKEAREKRRQADVNRLLRAA